MADDDEGILVVLCIRWYLLNMNAMPWILSLKDINETHLLSSFWYSFLPKIIIYLFRVSSLGLYHQIIYHDVILDISTRERVIIKVSTNDVFWTWIHLRGSQTGLVWYNLNKLQCVIRYDTFYVMWQMNEQFCNPYLCHPNQISDNRILYIALYDILS